MININRGTGYIPDKPNSYPTHHELMRSARIILPYADHYGYRSGYTYQNGFGLCVYKTIRRAIQIRFAILGINSEYLIADTAAYVFGRAWEYVRNHPGIAVADIPKLEDIGSMPLAALKALQNGGVIPENLMPGTEAHEHFDQSGIFMAPKDFPNSLLVEAFNMSGLQFVEVIYDTFEDFCMHIKTLMVQGFPLMYALNADSSEYQNCGKSLKVINSLNDKGQNHYNSILTAEGNIWRGDNWWRRGVIRDEQDEWGEYDGSYLINPEAIYEGASNVLALTWTPNA